VSSDTLISTISGSSPERFETILSQPRFEALKALLRHLSTDPEALHAAILGTDTYEEFLARFGRKLVLTRQVHVQEYSDSKFIAHRGELRWHLDDYS
jgi:hypothetical protein